MALGEIGFLVVDAAGAPKTNASPLFSIYRAGGGDRTPPTGSLATPIPHRGGGAYGVIAPPEDVAARTAFLIELGAGAFNASGGARIFGSVAPDGAPLFVQLLEDSAGALWTGAALTLGIWNDFTGAVITPKPSVDAIAGAYLWGCSPAAAEVSAGRLGRFDAPAGAYPQFPFFTAYSNPSATTGTSIGVAIRTELLADSAVTALVGTQIFPNVAPQGTVPPYIVYTVISNVPDRSFTGAPAELLNEIRLQLDCYGRKYEDAQAIAAAVDAVLAALSRPDLAGQRENWRDLYDNEAQFHRVALDFLIQR